MKVTNKLHRVMSIIIGVVMIFVLISGITSMVTSITALLRSGNPTSLLTALPSHLLGIGSTVVFIIVLFRGKKDLAAGILMLLTALYPLFALFTQTISLFGGFLPDYFRIYSLMNMLANITMLAFRILLGVECLACGCLSGGFGKIFLVVPPLAVGLFQSLASTVITLYNYQGSDLSTLLVPLITAFLPPLLGTIPTLLMGVTFAIPVRETISSAP